MKKHTSLIVNLLVFLHFLLAFLLVFESQLKIPFWIEPLGRMHPLVLHFPVAFVSLLALLNVFKKQLDIDSYDKINGYLLLMTFLSTTVSTLMGLILSLESSNSELLSLHKWIGVAISFMLFMAIPLKENKSLYSGLLYLSFISIIFAGHYGARLTHGTNFISEPIVAELSPKHTESNIYLSYVEPIITKKCVSCHNDQKQKGGLDLSTLKGIEKGGKHGNLWEIHKPEESNFIKRVLLPEENKKHMPPAGKSQLSKKEITLIKLWIAQGANDSISYVNLKDSDPLKIIMTKTGLSIKKPRKQFIPFPMQRKLLLNN